MAISVNFGGAKPKKDAEGGRPYLLVTVNLNKLTPTHTVKAKLNLESSYNEDGSIDEEGAPFNIGTGTDDNGEKIAIIYQDEAGYKVGKNGSVSAPYLVSTLLEHFELDRETYEQEDSTLRSFKLYFNSKPIYMDENGNSSTADNAVVTAFKLSNPTNVERSAEEVEVEEVATATKKGKKKSDA